MKSIDMVTGTTSRTHAASVSQRVETRDMMTVNVEKKDASC